MSLACTLSAPTSVSMQKGTATVPSFLSRSIVGKARQHKCISRALAAWRHSASTNVLVKALAAKPVHCACDSSESLCSVSISAVLSPKCPRMTRLVIRPRYVLRSQRRTSSRYDTATSATLRRDASPASPVNARLSRAPRLGATHLP